MSHSLFDLGLTTSAHATCQVTGLSLDSRRVKKGHLFAALPGSQTHGAAHAMGAVQNGAGAILTDAEGAQMLRQDGLEPSFPLVITQDPRADFARCAALWYAAQPGVMAAVTGTNGKTSVSSFLRQIWTHLGFEAINLGTTGVEGALIRPLAHTTPDVLTLHDALEQAHKMGVTHAAMEASSHGLDQRRLDGVQLLAGAFTNLSQDHLDYHHDLESYFDAKMGLFERVLPQEATAVLNRDDPWYAKAAARAQARGLNIITVGKDPLANICLRAQSFHETGQKMLFSVFDKTHEARLELVGGFQAVNVLCAAGLAIGCGGEPEEVASVLGKIKPVRGRMELAAKRADGGAVFVDYAHTPDAIHTAITALRPHVMGRVIALIGAGGDRDRTKRSLMGQAAAQTADAVIITDDNPRSEDPASIRQEVAQGAPEADIVADRSEAILRGVDAVGPGDALVICGKGHETGQVIDGVSYPFDDVEQASLAVAALEGRGL